MKNEWEHHVIPTSMMEIKKSLARARIIEREAEVNPLELSEDEIEAYRKRLFSE